MIRLRVLITGVGIWPHKGIVLAGGVGAGVGSLSSVRRFFLGTTIGVVQDFFSRWQRWHVELDDPSGWANGTHFSLTVAQLRQARPTRRPAVSFSGNARPSGDGILWLVVHGGAGRIRTSGGPSAPQASEYLLHLAVQGRLHNRSRSPKIRKHMAAPQRCSSVYSRMQVVLCLRIALLCRTRQCNGPPTCRG
jgi:hypothetical protein